MTGSFIYFASYFYICTNIQCMITIAGWGNQNVEHWNGARLDPLEKIMLQAHPTSIGYL